MLKYITIAFALVFSSVVSAQTITGAGATFPYPVYSKWTDQYSKETGIRVNYQSVGSGAGIKQIQTKTVTFGASDMPLTDAELDKHGLFQFPTVVGGNVMVFNLDGITKLNLDGPTIADIYLNKIKKWNDERIVKLNPGVNLPNASILVVRRSDGSGTTYIFTKYLQSVSKEWADKVGIGTAIEWPVGIGAKGNEGVAGNVAQTKYSIGYVEYAFAKQNKIAYTTIDGVSASTKSFQDGSWPITAPTYIIMYKKPVNLELAKEAVKFFDWAYTKGDSAADELDYVPLSQEVKDKVRAEWFKHGLK